MESSVATEASDLLAAFNANMRWARAHDGELGKHSGRYVAIDDSKVLGVADTAKELEERFRERRGLYVTFIASRDLLWVL